MARRTSSSRPCAPSIPKFVFLGVPPIRIDLLASIPGVEFEAAYASRVETTWAGTPVHIIGREELVAAKLAAGRPTDRLDVKALLRPR